MWRITALQIGSYWYVGVTAGWVRSHVYLDYLCWGRFQMWVG